MAGSPKQSAGLLMFRRGRTAGDAREIQVLLVHPGGPLWRNKDENAWTIPKGLIDPGEDALAAAQREFREETGIDPCGPFMPLGQIKQKSGKLVQAWAFEGDCDPAAIKSNTFEMEWPPRSNRMATFPEVDRADFFTLQQAARKINPAQRPLLVALQNAIASEK